MSSSNLNIKHGEEGLKRPVRIKVYSNIAVKNVLENEINFVKSSVKKKREFENKNLVGRYLSPICMKIKPKQPSQT